MGASLGSRTTVVGCVRAGFESLRAKDSRRLRATQELLPAERAPTTGLDGGRAARDNPLMPQATRDLRIQRFRPLIPPAILLEELPLSEAGALTVTRGRAEIVRILRQDDDRLVVVVGPCSVHD